MFDEDVRLYITDLALSAYEQAGVTITYTLWEEH